MKNLKTILTLIAGIIIGVCCTNIFSCNNVVLQPKITTQNTTVKAIETQVQQSTQHYQQSMDSLQIHNNTLIKQLTTTKQNLAIVKQKSIVLQTQLYDLIDAKKTSNDTSLTNNNCVALENKVVALMQSNTVKDSVYDAVVTTLETQVQNKDSTLQVKDTFINKLQTAIDKSLTQQGFVSEQNKMYQLQFKRQKFRNKFLSVGVLVVCGLLANQLLQH
jgi:hypothetical protein